jgi:hypothetical protein
MKIGYFRTTPFPTLRADNVHVAQMVRSMSNLGHDVTLFIPREQRFASNEEAIEEARRLFGEPLGFKIAFIRRITLFGKGQTLGSAWGAWRALKEAKLELYCFP